MDFTSLVRTLPPRTIIRATGNPKFLQSLLKIAGDNVRIRKALPGEDQSILYALRSRLRSDPDRRPVIVSGRLKPARFYDRDNRPDIEIASDFDDVGHVTFHEYRPGHVMLRIIGGKTITVVVTA